VKLLYTPFFEWAAQTGNEAVSLDDFSSLGAAQPFPEPARRQGPAPLYGAAEDVIMLVKGDSEHWESKSRNYYGESVRVTLAPPTI
jgi:hypothetical protein